jgi:hypothetical protein
MPQDGDMTPREQPDATRISRLPFRVLEVGAQRLTQRAVRDTLHNLSGIGTSYLPHVRPRLGKGRDEDHTGQSLVALNRYLRPLLCDPASERVLAGRPQFGMAQASVPRLILM